MIPSARQPGRHVRLGVRVRDARTRAPIAGCEITLRDGAEPPRVLRADEAGRAAAELVARTQVEVSAPGYEELRTNVPFPHRGEWLDAELRLSSLRDAAAAPLGTVAERLLGSADAAAVATGKDVLRAAARRGKREALEPLVHHTERAAYGPEAPTRADVETIRDEARAASQELDQPRE